MDEKLRLKMEKLRSRIRKLDSAIIAFSGGSDSTFLTRICREELGERAVAVTMVKDYPRSDLELAKSIAKVIGVKHITIQDGFDIEKVAKDLSIDNIVIGHNADKNQEKKKKNIINPLFDITKKDIENFRKEKLGQYLETKGIRWKFQNRNILLYDNSISKDIILEVCKKAKLLGFKDVFLQVS